MKLELFAATTFLIIITVSLTGLSVLTIRTIYGQEFNNSTGTSGNMTRFAYTSALYDNMSNYINQLTLFSEACNDFIRLQVEEETDNCRVIAEEFNDHMEQLLDRHRVTILKNMMIAAKPTEADVPPELLPEPTFYCDSYQVNAGLTDEQCKAMNEEVSK